MCCTLIVVLSPPPPPPPWLRLLSILRGLFLLMLTFCLSLLPLWESVFVLWFVVRYFMSILVLQSSWWGRESWLLCLICLPGVSWWLSGPSSWRHGIVCGLWLWYLLIILTYYFCLFSYRGGGGGGGGLQKMHLLSIVLRRKRLSAI